MLTGGLVHDTNRNLNSRSRQENRRLLGRIGRPSYEKQGLSNALKGYRSNLSGGVSLCLLNMLAGLDGGLVVILFVHWRNGGIGLLGLSMRKVVGLTGRRPRPFNRGTFTSLRSRVGVTGNRMLRFEKHNRRKRRKQNRLLKRDRRRFVII